MSDFTYQVQPGDTLSELAQRYRVSTQTLARLNGIGDVHRIWEGQFLTIPGEAPSSGSATTRRTASTNSKQSAQALRVTGVTVPKTGTVGKSVKAEASQFIPLKPTATEKAGVSWCVLFEGKLIERFERHGPVLDYQVPYFLIESQGRLQPHRSPFIDSKDKALAKAKRTPLVHKSLQFKAYTRSENEGVTQAVELEPNYDRFDNILAFMFDEMTRNARGKDAQSIRKNMDAANQAATKADKALKAAENSSGFWDKIFTTLGGSHAAKSYLQQATTENTIGLSKFFVLVRTDGPWDHKSLLQKNHETHKDAWIPFRGDPNNEFFHDIWSNVHYAYVGRAIGISAADLMTFGADISGPFFGDNDEGDKLSVQLGLDLWKAHGMNLKKEHLAQAILAAKSKFIALASKDPENRKIQAMRNGY